MLVTKRSIMSGLNHTLDLPITQEQLDRYNRGLELVQNIFPNLTPSQREFLMSGTTDEEWKEAFGGMEEEEEDNNDVRRCHSCGHPTINKYCANDTCEVYLRDEKYEDK